MSLPKWVIDKSLKEMGELSQLKSSLALLSKGILKISPEKEESLREKIKSLECLYNI